MAAVLAYAPRPAHPRAHLLPTILLRRKAEELWVYSSDALVVEQRGALVTAGQVDLLEQPRNLLPAERDTRQEAQLALHGV